MRPSQTSAFTTGRRVLCQYLGDTLWHERLLLGRVDEAGFVWAIATPDGDVYIEDFQNDVAAVRIQPMSGGRPQGLVGPIYPFRAAPTARELAAWNRHARSDIDAWVPPAPAARPAAARPPGATTPATPAPPVPLAGPAPVHSVHALVASEGTPAPGGGAVATAVTEAGRVWISTEWSTCGTMEAGVALAGQYTKAFVADYKGLFFLEGGGTVVGEMVAKAHQAAQAQIFSFVAEVKRDSIEGIKWTRADDTPRGGQPAEDARLLPIREMGGRRHREWSSVGDVCTEIEMKQWPIEGPRSAIWVVQFLARLANGGPEPYHRWWRSATKLGMADWGVPEHQQLCRYLHLMGCYDQLDIGNLAVSEAICRRLQLIEYQYRERSRESARGGAQGGAASSSLTGLAVMGSNEADLFDGIGRLDSVVCVSPQLVSWISQELQKTADIDKAARKAREERALNNAAVHLPSPPLLDAPAPDDPAGTGKKGKKGKG